MCKRVCLCVKASMCVKVSDRVKVSDPCPIDSDPLSVRDVHSFFQPSALSFTCHLCAWSDSLMSVSQTFRSSVRVPHVVGMASEQTLQRLRALARDHGPERLKSTLLDYKRDELRALAQAAGLRVRKA